MNEFKFFGTAIETPNLVEYEKGNKYCNINIEVKRNYTNIEGNIEFDNFKITCFRQMAEEASNKLKKGDRLIIRGRVQQNVFIKDDKTYSTPELIGEKFEILD